METDGENSSTVGLDSSLLDHQALQWPLWNEWTCFDVVPSIPTAPHTKKNQDWAPGESCPDMDMDMDVDMNQTWVWQQNWSLDYYHWCCQGSKIRSAKFTNRFFWHCSHRGKDIWEFIKWGLTLPPSPSQRSLSIPGGGNHLSGCSPPYWAKYLEWCPRGQ